MFNYNLVTLILISCLFNELYAAKQEDLSTFIQSSNCTYCDLTHITIQGNYPDKSVYFGDLSHTTLKGNFNHLNLQHVDMVNGVLSGNFDNAYFGMFTHLDGANLSHSSFKNADFGYDTTSYRGAIFDGADLRGARILALHLASAASLCNAILPDGRISGCVFGTYVD